MLTPFILVQFKHGLQKGNKKSKRNFIFSEAFVGVVQLAFVQRQNTDKFKLGVSLKNLCWCSEHVELCKAARLSAQHQQRRKTPVNRYYSKKKKRIIINATRKIVYAYSIYTGEA